MVVPAWPQGEDECATLAPTPCAVESSHLSSDMGINVVRRIHVICHVMSLSPEAMRRGRD